MPLYKINIAGDGDAKTYGLQEIPHSNYLDEQLKERQDLRPLFSRAWVRSNPTGVVA